MKLFAVVGMHRAGTSLVARMLNLLGAHLGPATDIMPPKPDNPTGFWESLSVTQMHDDLLAELGGKWDRPPVLEPGWELEPERQRHTDRIFDIVTSHFASSEIGVWKDPRGAFLLPLWRRVVPIAGTIVCVRDPDEVAHSLATRDGMASERAAALWLRYVVAAWLDNDDNVLVRFDEPYEQPLELMRRLSVFVGAAPPSAEVLGAASHFVDASLRHYPVQGDQVGPLMRLARAAYALLVNDRRDVTRPFFVALSDGWRLEAQLEREMAARAALRGKLFPSVLEILKGQSREQ